MSRDSSRAYDIDESLGKINPLLRGLNSRSLREESRDQIDDARRVADLS